MDVIVVEPSRGMVAAPMEVDSACPGKFKLPATSRFGADKIVVQEKDVKGKKEVAAPPAVVKATACAKLVHVRTMSEGRSRSRRNMELFLGWLTLQGLEKRY